MRWIELTFDVPETETPITGMRVLFPPTRTFIPRPPRVLDREVVEPVPPAFPVLEVRWLPRSEPTVTLEVPYLGEAPQPATALFRVGTGDDAAFWNPSSPSGRELEFASGPPAGGSADLSEARRVFLNEVTRIRCRAIRNAPESMRTALRFFFDLDVNSNAALLRNTCRPDNRGEARTGLEPCIRWPPPTCGDIEAHVRRVERMGELLTQCVQSRILRLLGMSATMPVLPPDELHRMSQFQYDIYAEYFGNGGTFDADAIQASFAMFAAGELEGARGDLYWNAKPNSPFYLLFAEFAIQCLEAPERPHEDLWRTALPALVSTQELFVQAHDVAPNWSATPVPVTRAPGSPPRSQSFAPTAARYRAMSVERLTEAHVRHCYELFFPAGPTIP